MSKEEISNDENVKKMTIDPETKSELRKEFRKKVKDKNPIGRPTTYNPDYHPAEAKKLALEGKFNYQIAAEFGINNDTFYVWQNKYAEFADAVKQGKQPQIEKLESTAMKVANGYYEEEYKGDEKKKYYKPDSKILSLLLFSLCGDKYKTKTENTNIDANKELIDSLTPEERKEKLKELFGKMDEEEKEAYIKMMEGSE